MEMVGSFVEDLRRFLRERNDPLRRLLVLNRWFLGALLFVLVLLGGLSLCLFRIWDSTPEGFRPVHRISMVDWLQAKSFLRSARRHLDEGNFAAAVHAWRSAIANDPGNLELCRGFLALLEGGDSQHRYLNEAVEKAFWLLRLGQTNVVDLEQVAKTFEHYSLERYTVELLETAEKPMTPELNRARLRALFLEGRMEAFELLWAEEHPERRPDEELELVGAAYRAGWGTPREATENIARIKEAMGRGESSTLAHRLNLIVSHVRLDPEAYRRSLSALESGFQDRPVDHVQFWRLLAELDRRGEAIQQATRYVRPPETAYEAMLFAEAFIYLGLRDLAFRFLQRYTEDYDAADRAWYTQALLLSEAERWDELYGLAMEIRRSEKTRLSLKGYSYFLEGAAELKRGHRMLARRAFETMLDYSLTGGNMGLNVAANLHDWRFFKEALDLLRDLKEDCSEQRVFWELLFNVALETGSSPDLLMAAENIYRLQPNNFTAKNNFAAVLLSMRTRPDEAISITFDALNQSRGGVTARINHAHALLLNQRVEEARMVLSGINAKVLSEPVKQGYYLAWLEVEVLHQRMREAVRYHELVQPKFLLPGDRDRFRELTEWVNRWKRD